MNRAPDPHCRIGKIWLKPNRYRAAGLFNVKLNELREAVARRVAQEREGVGYGRSLEA